jgi:hypothetical protein
MKAWFWEQTRTLFPDYRFWDSYTWERTAAWLGIFIGAGAWLAWREYGASLQSIASRPRETVVSAVSRLRAVATG